ncbi:thiolase family protein [Metasolibacillus fluoroglycofenilyticus]|uniref:thiolase family protein n=1 Tax=Metasolibacillus fluoroglycofenilyticus TaxID=1239396 RepID=UPI000D37F880|nr:acetyl-CoA C-acyltransferase [Metasolibacillus fluoroglycofenilyticus]
MGKEVYIIDAVRTPIGKYRGGLKEIRPDDLAAHVIRALIDRNPTVPFDDIDDIIFGNANGAGEDNRNVARMATLLAGLPKEISATTVNRLCGSGLDAVAHGARSILAGEADIVITGGVESMTRAPFVMAKPENDFPRGDMTVYDTTIGWRFINPVLDKMYGTEVMPKTAENVAQRFNISRERQDLFSYNSQKKAATAMELDKFKDEIIAVEVKDKKGNITQFVRDEHIRPNVTLEKLAALKPIFDNGTVTAGNASGVNDGAAALILMSKEKAESLGLKPLVKYTFTATAGLEPSIMGLGPIYSTRKLLEKCNLTIADFDLIELNEAFASQAIACIDMLKIDESKVNVNGGAIALGHPLGASGARILTTLIYEMKRRNAKRGLASMCIGVGQGISLAVENLE